MILGEEINRRRFGDSSIPEFSTSFCTAMLNYIDVYVANPPRTYHKPIYQMFYEFINLKRSINFKNTDEDRNN